MRATSRIAGFGNPAGGLGSCHVRGGAQYKVRLLAMGDVLIFNPQSWCSVMCSSRCLLVTEAETCPCSIIDFAVDVASRYRRCQSHG